MSFRLKSNYSLHKTSFSPINRIKQLIQEIKQLEINTSPSCKVPKNFCGILVLYFTTLMFFGIKNINKALNYKFKTWSDLYSHFGDPITIILKLEDFLPFLIVQDQVLDFYKNNQVYLKQILLKVNWGNYAEAVSKGKFFLKNHSNLNKPSLTEINFDLFDKIAEFLLEYNNKPEKPTGTIYTPYYLAEQITQRSVSQWYKKNEFIEFKKSPNQSLHLLDPTVGTGTFLIAAGNVLYNIFRKKNPNSSSFALRKLIIEINLHGFDKDPIGVIITKIKLRLWIVDDFLEEKTLYKDLADNIYLGDSLFGYFNKKNLSELKTANKEEQKKVLTSSLIDETSIYKFPTRSSLHERIVDINLYHKKIFEETDEYYIIIEGSKREWNEYKTYLAKNIRNRVHFSISDYFNPSNDTYLVYPNKIQKINKELSMNLIPWNFPEKSHANQQKIRTKFDIIIGNPPFIALTDLSMITRLHIKRIFPKIYNGNSDLSYIYTRRILLFLKPSGVLGFLLPKSFLSSVHAEKIRDILKRKISLLEIHDFNDILIFPHAKIKTCFILLINQIFNPDVEFTAFKYSKSIFNQNKVTKLYQNKLKSSNWTILRKKTTKIIEKLISISNYRLREIASISKGIETGCDNIFAPKELFFFSKKLQLEPFLFKPWLKGKEINPFTIKREGREVLYAPKSRQELIKNSKIAYQYLKDNRNELLNRSRVSEFFLWRDGDERNTMNWQEVKIVTPYKAKYNTFAIDDTGCLSSKDVVWIIPHEKYNDSDSLLFLVSLLNSKTLTFYAQCTFKDLGGIFDYYPHQIRNLPLFIPARNSEEFLDIVRTAKQIHESSSDRKKILMGQIDRIIYQLYKLTKSQISEINSFLNL